MANEDSVWKTLAAYAEEMTTLAAKSVTEQVNGAAGIWNQLDDEGYGLQKANAATKKLTEAAVKSMAQAWVRTRDLLDDLAG